MIGLDRVREVSPLIGAIFLACMTALDAFHFAKTGGIIADSGIIFGATFVVLAVVCWLAGGNGLYLLVNTPEWIFITIATMCICAMGTSFAGMLEVQSGSNFDSLTSGVLLGMSIVLFGMFLYIRKSERLQHKRSRQAQA